MDIKSCPTAYLNSPRERDWRRKRNCPWQFSLPAPERSLPDRAETQIEDHHENLSTDLPPEEPRTDDNFTLPDATTHAQDEHDTGISQMEAAGIESDLNNLLTIDDPSPSPTMVADPVTNLEPAAATSVQDLPADQPDE